MLSISGISDIVIVTLNRCIYYDYKHYVYNRNKYMVDTCNIRTIQCPYNYEGPSKLSAGDQNYKGALERNAHQR